MTTAIAARTFGRPPVSGTSDHMAGMPISALYMYRAFDYQAPVDGGNSIRADALCGFRD